MFAGSAWLCTSVLQEEVADLSQQHWLKQLEAQAAARVLPRPVAVMADWQMEELQRVDGALERAGPSQRSEARGQQPRREERRAGLGVGAARLEDLSVEGRDGPAQPCLFAHK